LFGIKVSATNGNTILVGASSQTYNTSPLGNAEVFSSLGTNQWNSQSLFPTAPSDESVGAGVAVNGDRALIQAKKSAYLFKKADSGIWALSLTLAPSAAEPGYSNYGFSAGAAITESALFSGFHYSAVGGDLYTVEIYDYSMNSAMPCAHQKSTNVGYGTAMAANSRWLAVGARGTGTELGTVCLLELGDACVASSNCTNITSTSMPTGQVGSTVAFSDDLLIVGAPGNSAQPFFVYQYDGIKWVLGSAQPDAVPGGEPWGTAIAADGDLVAVSEVAVNSAGKVRIYQWRNRQWVLLSSDSPTKSGFDFTLGGFGSSVAVSGDLVVVGAPTATVPTTGGAVQAGAVVVYRCPVVN